MQRPTRRFLSSAHVNPPKPETPRRKRGVFVLGVVLGAAALVPHAARAQEMIGHVSAADATVKGSVRESAGGLEIGNGSLVTAGERTATLHLARGGRVRICPGTNITVNGSPKGPELMFAMSTGSIEGEYQLPATADTILTPDFRILISGPGSVNVYVSAQPNGDTCVHTRGIDSYVVVSELVGDDFYRVKPDESVLFHSGQVKNPETNGAMNCGCPATPAIERAEAAPPPAPQTQAPAAQNPVPAAQAAAAQSQIQLPQTPPPATPAQKAAAVAAIQTEPAVAATANAAAALPPQPKGSVQVEVDAPMVFQGTGAGPDVTQTLARVHIEHLPWPDTPNVSPEAPAKSGNTKAQNGTEKKGFFHRIIRALFG
jgi:hypothetical protein